MDGVCNDYIQFYEGNMNKPLTEKLCGSQKIDDIKTIDTHVVLRFHTNDNVTKRGFEIYYMRIEDYEVSLTLLIKLLLLFTL